MQENYTFTVHAVTFNHLDDNNVINEKFDYLYGDLFVRTERPKTTTKPWKPGGV